MSFDPDLPRPVINRYFRVKVTSGGNRNPACSRSNEPRLVERPAILREARPGWSTSKSQTAELVHIPGREPGRGIRDTIRYHHAVISPLLPCIGLS
jgi:hypothetical protein